MLADRLWDFFDAVDHDDDRRITADEFYAAVSHNNFKLKEKTATEAFEEMDVNGGGQVLFDEFCKYVAEQYIDAAEIDAAYEGTLAAGSVRQELADAHREARKKIEAEKQRQKEELRREMENVPTMSVGTGADAFAEDIAACKELLTRESLDSLWRQMDYNKNGTVSLAEIDKLVVSMAADQEGPFKDFDNKPALMRAFKVSCARQGTDSDLIEPGEFPFLIRNLFFYDR